MKCPGEPPNTESRPKVLRLCCAQITMDLVEARKKASKLHRILKSFSGVLDYGKKHETRSYRDRGMDRKDENVV